MPEDISPKTAFQFVLLISIVSLFADMTYEGARGVAGPYLGLLGASGTLVGFTAGVGELAGYGLRWVSGLFVDRTHAYWKLAFMGYAINLLAVPLLALTGHWPAAASLFILERVGKAIRTPARDVMLSHATEKMGRGRGFGFHEAMDQTGAMLGPLLMTGMLFFNKGYHAGFAVLGIPAIFAVSTLFMAQRFFPHPETLEAPSVHVQTDGLPHSFWIFLMGIGCLAMGYADFPLIAFHLGKTALIQAAWIPLFYALTMAIEGISAWISGHWFDRIGPKILIFAGLLAACSAPLAFGSRLWMSCLGLAIWGMGLGAQSSVMKAMISNMIPRDRRGAAFGLFHAGYGILWFLGSAIMGVLYDKSLSSLILFSILSQLAAIPILLNL